MFGNATARDTEPLAGGTMLVDSWLDDNEADVDDVADDELEEAELTVAELEDTDVGVDDVLEVVAVSPEGPFPKTK